MTDPERYLRPQVEAWLADSRHGRQGALMTEVECDLANLPAHLSGRVGLVFEFPAAVSGLTTDATGMWVSLRFNGVWHRCRVPWGSVVRMYDRETLAPYKPRLHGTPGPDGTRGCPRAVEIPLGSNVVPFRRKP